MVVEFCSRLVLCCHLVAKTILFLAQVLLVNKALRFIFFIAKYISTLSSFIICLEILKVLLFLKKSQRNSGVLICDVTGYRKRMAASTLSEVSGQFHQLGFAFLKI